MVVIFIQYYDNFLPSLVANVIYIMRVSLLNGLGLLKILHDLIHFGRNMVWLIIDNDFLIWVVPYFLFSHPACK